MIQAAYCNLYQGKITMGWHVWSSVLTWQRFSICKDSGAEPYCRTLYYCYNTTYHIVYGCCTILVRLGDLCVRLRRERHTITSPDEGWWCNRLYISVLDAICVMYVWDVFIYYDTLMAQGTITHLCLVYFWLRIMLVWEAHDLPCTRRPVLCPEPWLHVGMSTLL